VHDLYHRKISYGRRLLTSVLKQVFWIMKGEIKRKLLWLLFINSISAMLGLMGIAAIMPFVGLLANPGLAQSNSILAFLYRYFETDNFNAFMTLLGFIILILFLLANGALAFSTWYNIRFLKRIGTELSSRLMESYLSRNYEFFLLRHSSDLVKNMYAETQRVVQNIINPGISLISRGLSSLALSVLLILMSPGIAFAIIALMGSIYALIYILMRKKMASAGRIITSSTRERFKAAQEAFGGIKDIKLLGKEKYYLEIFRQETLLHEKAQGSVEIIRQLPKYILETLAFGGMLALVIALFSLTGQIGDALSLLTLYAFALYRLLPAFEVIFRSLAEIKSNLPAVDILFQDLSHTSADDSVFSSEPLTFHNTLELFQVEFSYAKSGFPSVKDISLIMKANTTIALVGTTGCGKTTLADIILGLLLPQKGQILVDQISLNQTNLKSWQKKIGYVPQQIYLSDTTLAKNIAFGVEEKQIDMEAVKRSARIANISDFIEKELPEGYMTHTGERGVRLSGGQRIGIARALYHNPELLVFDEATSALDNLTEEAVMEAIDRLMGTKTIILIAHRLSTVKKCDSIFYMEKGRIIARGNYEELLASCEPFRKSAQL